MPPRVEAVDSPQRRRDAEEDAEKGGFEIWHSRPSERATVWREWTAEEAETAEVSGRGVGMATPGLPALGGRRCGRRNSRRRRRRLWCGGLRRGTSSIRGGLPARRGIDRG